MRQSTDGSVRPHKRGCKPIPSGALKADNERLTRELARVAERLRQVELIVDVQKKLCLMLGLTPAEQGR
jgi:hypothetical protein